MKLKQVLLDHKHHKLSGAMSQRRPPLHDFQTTWDVCNELMSGVATTMKIKSELGVTSGTLQPAPDATSDSAPPIDLKPGTKTCPLHRNSNTHNLEECEVFNMFNTTNAKPGTAAHAEALEKAKKHQVQKAAERRLRDQQQLVAQLADEEAELSRSKSTIPFKSQRAGVAAPATVEEEPQTESAPAGRGGPMATVFSAIIQNNPELAAKLDAGTDSDLDDTDDEGAARCEQSIRDLQERERQRRLAMAAVQMEHEKECKQEPNWAQIAASIPRDPPQRPIPTAESAKAAAQRHHKHAITNFAVRCY